MKSIDDMDFFEYMDVYIYERKQLLRKAKKLNKKEEKKVFIDELGFL